MGASSSNSSRDTADGVLVGALRGRRMDLPGGGELCMSANAGVQKAKFMVDGGSDPLYLFLIGVGAVCDCERRFIIYRSKDGRIYGREGRDNGLHVLADTLREMLCKVGITNRDLRVLSGRFTEKEYRSPMRDRSKFSDSILGRKRGVSVDSDRCRAGAPNARPANTESVSKTTTRRPSSSLLSRTASVRGPPESRRGYGDHCSTSTVVATVKSAPARPPDDFCTVANRIRNHPLGGSRVRFGSATVYGSDCEREDVNDHKMDRGRDECRERRLNRHPSGLRSGRGRKLSMHNEVDELSLESENAVPTGGNRPSAKTPRTQRREKDCQTPQYPQTIARDGEVCIGINSPRGYRMLSPPRGNGGRPSSIDYGSECDSCEDCYEEHDEVMF